MGYMQSIWGRTLRMLFLILMITLFVDHYYPHFTDEEVWLREVK